MNKSNKFTYLTCFCFLWKYAKKFWYNFFVFFCGCLLDYTLFIAVPIISGIMLDQMVYYGNINIFLKLGILQVFIVILYSYNYFVTYNQHSYLTSNFLYNIKSDGFRHLLASTPTNLQNKSTGEYIAIIDDFAGEALNFYIKNFIHNITNILNVLFCVVYIFIIDWKLGCVILIIVPVSVIISHFFGKKVRTYAEDKQKYFLEYSGKVVEWLRCLRDIKLISGQKKVFRDFINENKTMLKLDVRVALSQINAKNMLAASQLILQLLLFLALTYLALGNKITIGAILVVLAYYSDTKMCIDALVNSHLDSKIRVENIKKFYDLMMQEEENINIGQELVIKRGNIRFENVNFQYNEKKLLKDITFDIRSGHKIGIVGKNGCGKSTLIYMLLRFLEPQSGEILIDDISIKEICLHSLRENIGVVFQDAYLFNTTIRENITLGKKNYSDNEIFMACKMAGIDEFIQSLPQNLDTDIGDCGRGISGGQKQRIVIARIYLQNPQVIVFDESTSSLDAETENEILNAWDKILEGKTVIIISHRLNSILKCDEAVLIKDGIIYEKGNPQELIRTSSYFNEVFVKEKKDV